MDLNIILSEPHRCRTRTVRVIQSIRVLTSSKVLYSHIHMYNTRRTRSKDYCTRQAGAAKTDIVFNSLRSPT